MLYPQRNETRDYIDLSDIWDFRFDKENEGFDSGWQEGFSDCRPIAVPASWNDQFAEERDYLGPAWYQYKFSAPNDWLDLGFESLLILRFGSVNYFSDAWLNGLKIGKHEGGHLPFEFDVSDVIQRGENILIVRVDGNLHDDTVPPSGRDLMDYPAVNFDFFPFCGIQRPVLLYKISDMGIKDITVKTNIEKSNGYVDIAIETYKQDTIKAAVLLERGEVLIEDTLVIQNGMADTILRVPDPELWEPGSPNLYDLTITLTKEEEIIDSYSLKIGIRSIEVKDDKLLLNGKPIYLRGFGRHEDFAVVGKGYLPAVIIKDYSLLDWVGANSFRTSHYPYSEQQMDLADRLGFLVIDEIPSVGLTFKLKAVDKQLALCKRYMEELIARDKNHPSVIIWSIANEPQASARSKEFFKELIDHTRSLDSTRLVTIVSMLWTRQRAFEYCDLMCLNRYHGWYQEPGQIDKGIDALSADLDEVYGKYKKPIIMSEFGADTIPGCHDWPSKMFSEEYQVEFIKQTIELLRTKPYLNGEHIWNLCDFKTSQSIRRVGAYNFKGVFTRDRRPKMAAHLLRKLWKDESIF